MKRGRIVTRLIEVDQSWVRKRARKRDGGFGQRHVAGNAATMDNVRKFSAYSATKGKGLVIIQQQNDPMIVIRQTDHAFLSGFFAREWGNLRFAKPEPFSSFCLAAAEHDNGWQEWELAAGVDPRTFAPYTFMTVPTEEHIALYQRGIDRVVKVDLYAALLVAAHCMELYDRTRATIPGYSAKYVKTQEQHVANDFVQRLRLQQLRLKADLRNDPAMKPYVDDKLIKINSQRLEALDRLSLYFCMGVEENTTIEAVPLDDDGNYRPLPGPPRSPRNVDPGPARPHAALCGRPRIPVRGGRGVFLYYSLYDSVARPGRFAARRKLV